MDQSGHELTALRICVNHQQPFGLVDCKRDLPRYWALLHSLPARAAPKIANEQPVHFLSALQAVGREKSIKGSDLVPCATNFLRIHKVNRHTWYHIG